MLILSRKAMQRVIIQDKNEIVITVLSEDDGTIRLGFDANKEVVIHREEVLARIRSGESRR